jgi:sRNA-binding protein
MNDPHDTIARLIERFPQCFAGPRPLQVGIFKDIIAAMPEIDPDELSAALGWYVTAVPYLKALTAKNAVRVNLSGEEVDLVTAAEAERAIHCDT